MTAPPTLLISRCPRRLGVDWTNASSWLGGAPRLGRVPWPRGKDEIPLHHAAQIDLADIAVKSPAPGLPVTGSLAFFIGDKGAVVYVPNHMSHPPTVPPADTPELSASGGSQNWRTNLAGQPLYPFWPLDITVLDVPPLEAGGDDDDDDIDERVAAHEAAQIAAIAKHVTRREFNLSCEQAFFGAPIPDWWQTAIHYANCLAQQARDMPKVFERTQASLDWARRGLAEAQAKGSSTESEKQASYVKMYEEKLAKLDRLQPGFEALAAKAVAWTKGRDPWAIISPEDQAHLVAISAKANPQFVDFTASHAAYSFDQLKQAMLKALPAAGDATHESLPEAVRQVIDEKRAPRPQWWQSAICFCDCLRLAVRLGVPLASKHIREALERDRRKLDGQQLKSLLASLRRSLHGPSKEAEEIEARIAANEAELEKLGDQEREFRRFVDEAAEWTKGRDPWQFMPPADTGKLSELMERADKEFKPFTSFYASRYLATPEKTTLLTLASADDHAYSTLPERARTFINRNCLLPPNVWHQMFGYPLTIQTAGHDNSDQHLLLQLTYDDLMFWDFGDNGAYQFWISPEDLKKQNWAAVNMTFECH
jgi:hypothetical protein